MTPIPDTLAYIRVSDPRQAAEDKVSLDVQRDAIGQLAGRLGRVLVAASWYVEPGFSAGTANRPAFQALLAFCETHRRGEAPGYVLVYKDDRWGRFDDAEESAYWRVHLRKLGWIVRFALADDTDDPIARGVLRAIGAAQASLERQTIRTRAKTGMAGAVAKGFWVNKAPFGYRRVALDREAGTERVLEARQKKAKNERLRLTPGPAAEVRFVQWLFDAYGRGQVTLNALVRQAPVEYPKPWVRRTLHFMLLNPAYVGDVVVGQTVSRARKAQARGYTERVVGRDAHPPLVDRDLWERVQALLTRNRRETSPTPGGYPLSGLLTCAACGQVFIGGGGKRGPAEDPGRFRHYRDSGAFKTPRCPGRVMTFLRRDIEPQVVDAVAVVMETHPIAELTRLAFERVLAAAHGDQEARRAALDAQRATDQSRLDRLIAAIADGVVAPPDARSQMAEIRARIERTTGELDRFRFDARRAERLLAERDRLVAVAVDFRAQAQRMGGLELRQHLRRWLRSAVVDKVAMTLTLQIRCCLMPEGLNLFTSAAHPEQADTPVVRVIHLKTKSEWATLREAAKRARRAVS